MDVICKFNVSLSVALLKHGGGLIKISGYLKNTLNRQWVDFQQGQTFTFEVIKDFLFSANFKFYARIFNESVRNKFAHVASILPVFGENFSKIRQVVREI